MIKVLIENSTNDNRSWISIPNENIKAEISNAMGESGSWTVAMMNCDLFSNSFLLCNLIDFNELVLELEEHYHFDVDDIKNLSVLNMLIEDSHYDLEQVRNIMTGEGFHMHNVKNEEELAKSFLSSTSTWYAELEELNLLRYFDFKSYGEQMIKDGEFLVDTENEIIIEYN